MHHLDHIILGINDLKKGIDQFEALTGVRPAKGGTHPELGTHNALVGLGEGAYLEILAPRPDSEAVAWLAKLRAIEEIEPFMIVVRSDDLAHTIRALDDAAIGYNLPTGGSRQAPDGSLLKWRLLTFSHSELSRQVFLIEWSRDSVHPSRTSRTGCRLASFRIRQPASSLLSRLLNILDLDSLVVDGRESSVEFVIEGRSGAVRFSHRM